ncbi:MAG: alanine racemase, partial [Fervidobacterium sp.]
VRNYLDNLRFFQNHCAPAKVMPVVKANAYGHGAVQLAKAAERIGIDYFAVAFLEEATELRKHGISSNILVFNYIEPDLLHIAQENNITITLYSWEQLWKYSKYIWRPKCHVKIDTGMRRLGVLPQESKDFIDSARKSGFEVEGAYTHFAVADSLEEEDIKFTKEQAEQFEKLDLDVKIKHMCNSGASLSKVVNCFDYVRVGIASYGLQPSESVYSDKLKPVLAWKSVVSHMKTIQPGDTISYGRTFKAFSEMKIATIPVGYADGYWRHLSNKGYVLIRGEKCPIVGRVCMDQFMVDVTHLSDVRIGDEVVLIGKQGDNTITAEEIAKLVGTINYEVTCRISERVPRKYEGLEL